MTILTPDRTAYLWDAWHRYQDDERQAFTQYQLTCRNLLDTRDAELRQARAAERSSWHKAIAAYRDAVSDWLRQYADDHSVSAREAEAGIRGAWERYTEARRHAWDELRSIETQLREKYRYDLSTASELYQRELGRARQAWQQVTGVGITRTEGGDADGDGR